MDNLNRWFQILANLGVLAGIAFLVVELSQNNTLMRASAFQTRSADLIQIAAMVAESEPLASALSKLNFPNALCSAQGASLEELSPVELTLFKQYVMAQLFRLQNLEEQFLHGLLKDRHHAGSLSMLQRLQPWAERLGIPEANIGKHILRRYDGPIADPGCGRPNAAFYGGGPVKPSDSSQ
jgi:hypothetical protein